VLTGNIRPLAEAKLGALGLGDPLDLAIGAYGDMDEVRAGLVQVARERAAGSDAPGSGGADFGGEATVLVGDTPLDVAAALATGARAVGVATGNFTEQELIAAGAHAVLPDLSDTARVRAAVLGSWAEGRAAS
jgi:phosphoglycolate phosphatase-like HAD superfamily hydrolase